MDAFKVYCNAVGFMTIFGAILLSDIPYSVQFLLIGIGFFIWEKKYDLDLSKLPKQSLDFIMPDVIPEIERTVIHKKGSRSEALYRVIE